MNLTPAQGNILQRYIQVKNIILHTLNTLLKKIKGSKNISEIV